MCKTKRAMWAGLFVCCFFVVVFFFLGGGGGGGVVGGGCIFIFLHSFFIFAFFCIFFHLTQIYTKAG